VKEFRNAVGGWLAWFGVAVGVISCISVLARIFDVGLQPVLADFIGFYRSLFHPLYEALRHIVLPFEVTPTMVEGASAYLALFGLSLRAELAPIRRRLPEGMAPFLLRPLYYSSPFVPSLWKGVIKSLFLIPALVFQPVIDLLMHRGIVRIAEAEHRELREAEEDYALIAGGLAGERKKVIENIYMFAAFPAAIVLFFAVNRYAVK
jgi:hypothetical protein